MTDFRPLRIMELSATSRGDSEEFNLSEADEKHAVVKRRIQAAKSLTFHPVDNEKNQLTAKLLELALAHKDNSRRSWSSYAASKQSAPLLLAFARRTRSAATDRHDAGPGARPNGRPTKGGRLPDLCSVPETT